MRGDTATYRLRCAFYRFGGDLQIGEQFQLPTAMIEGSLLAHDSLHAAYSRRELGVFDVQFDISGELAVMAMRAQVVGPRYSHLADGGQNRLAT